MEESDSNQKTITSSDISRSQTATQGERRPLLHPSMDDLPEGASAEEESQPVAGGTLLGIHNLSIVSPQFIVRVDILIYCSEWAYTGMPPGCGRFQHYI